MTLTEVTVVIVLAAMVMTGLLVFYLNAQSIWLEGSAQAITQREVSLALQAIGRQARRSASAHVDVGLDLYNVTADADSTFRFWLAADSSLHSGYPDAVDGSRHDLGPVIQSKVTAFSVWSDSNMVHVEALSALTPQGGRITMGTSASLMNRAVP